MKLFKYILILFFLFGATTYAQQFRFKTTSVSVLQQGTKGKSAKWSKPTPTEIIISLDYDKDKIVIYSSEIQHYKILEYLPKEVTKVDEINSFICRNHEGIAVKIAIILRLDVKKAQLYVYHKDFTFAYDILEME
jgi:hypothetical protein